MTRIFYAVFVADEDVADILNCLLLVCNRSEKWPAHVTVRGPYVGNAPPQTSTKKWDQKIKNRQICVDGPGAFTGAKQATVYLRCSAPQLKEVWWKRDYDFAPHLTIYDGSSRDFADKLLNLFANHRLDFCFRASGLEKIASASQRQLPFNSRLWTSVSAVSFWKLTGFQKTLDVLKQLSVEQRLECVKALLDEIALAKDGVRRTRRTKADIAMSGRVSRAGRNSDRAQREDAETRHPAALRRRVKRQRS